MIKKIWNKITTFLSGYYSEHKDDIIIGFVIATVVGILFKATVATCENSYGIMIIIIFI